MVNAQTITMRADRRFLWLWLTVATSLSVAGNVGHAWLVSSQSDTSKFWMALGWAAAPPALLMLSVHGLPTLARMMEQTRSDRLLSIVVWGVTSGAFVWSAVGIFEFTVAMGVPSHLAWVAPLTIDMSVFGATRGLVLTAPIAARMKVGELSGDSSENAHGELTEDVQESAPETSGELIEDSPENVPESVRESPKVRPEVRSRRAGFTTEIEVLAQRVSDETNITIPSRTIEAVLRRTAQGDTRGKISSQLKGVSPTTVGRIVAAARGFDGEKEGELVAA